MNAHKTIRYRLHAGVKSKYHQIYGLAGAYWCVWNHRVSRRIVDKFDVVHIQDLKIQNITKSAKGTVGNPCFNVKAKSRLNKAIFKTGWHKLERMLSYKTSISKVKPNFTSLTCFKCRHKDKWNRKLQSGFECVSCGHSDNVAINSAKNILDFGSRESLNGYGDLRTNSTVKRQKWDGSESVKLSVYFPYFYGDLIGIPRME